jgi:hypothetical protein
MTILSWNRAAIKRIGHICTAFRLETQTYVLVLPIMFSMGRDYSSYARHVHVAPIIMCLISPLTS